MWYIILYDLVSLTFLLASMQFPPIHVYIILYTCTMYMYVHVHVHIHVPTHANTLYKIIHVYILP